MSRSREARLPFRRTPGPDKSAYLTTPLAFPTLRTKAGGLVALAKAPAKGGLARLKRVPPFWRCLNPSLAGALSEQRLNLWLLVLTAKKMPYRVVRAKTSLIYVPCMVEQLALNDITAVEKERPVPIFVPPVRDNMAGVALFLALFFVWHGLRFQWFGQMLPSPPFPATPSSWAALYGLDMPRFRDMHELWRAVTALTLHADDAHLFSNLGFGLIFLTALCRRGGLGLGILLTVLGGICGNSLNALLQPVTDALSPWQHGGTRHVISIGFSTALFASLGALCAQNASDILAHQKRFAHLLPQEQALLPVLLKRLGMPLAAGLALLGILGGGSEAKTDYAAHIWGFFCGAAVCCAALPLERLVFALPKPQQARAQGLLLALALALPCLCWVYAVMQ